MLVSDFLSKVNRAYRGFEEDAPVFGTDEADYFLDTANRKKDEWARDTNQNWTSLWENRTMGTISTTQTYDMDDDFIKPSDDVTVLLSNGNNLYYYIDKPQDRSQYRDYSGQVYFSGFDPIIMTFNETLLATSQAIGGTLYVPAYFLPDDIAQASDVIPVDDPNWLVMATAAELAFNDTSYVEKYDDLNAKANALYTQMIARNRSGTASNGRKVKTVNPFRRGSNPSGRHERGRVY